MIVVNNLKLRPGESEKRLQKMAAQALKLRVEILPLLLYIRSLWMPVARTTSTMYTPGH